MTTLADEYAKFKKLDAERTQGEIRAEQFPDGAAVLRIGETGKMEADMVFSEGCYGDDPGLVQQMADAQYLASTPAMMAFIDELMARLEVAQTSLRDIAYTYTFCLSTAHGYKEQLEHEREKVARMQREAKEALAALDAPLEGEK